jgi:error-prone DNA polymerase
MQYAELQITSNFSFMCGGSHPEELVEKAIALSYTHIAITDRNTVAGVVRGYLKTRDEKECRLKFIPACRLDLLDGPSLLAYPKNVKAWSRLCALLSLGNLRTEKGKCDLYKQDVYEHSADIIFVIVPPRELNSEFDFEPDFKKAIVEYQHYLKEQLYIAASCSYTGNDDKRFYRLAKLKIPMVATGNIYYHEPERRQLQDIETCVREKCTIHNAGFKLYANAERHLKPVEEIERLFRHYPEMLTNTQVIANQCHFSLEELKYLEPEWKSPDGRNADEHLAEHTWKGAKKFFGEKIPRKQINQIEFELEFFKKRQLAPYFLRVFEYTQKAEELGILHQGRGSAANCTVCFCLGITPVNPAKQNMLFSRFMSDAREEWPDVDVDFEHERREEIIQWIYETYGREHAGIVATVTQQRHKGAMRDVGKSMGLSEDVVKRLGSSIWDFKTDGFDRDRLTSQGLSPDDPQIIKVLELTKQMMGFPRQLGQHTGGFVIMRCKLSAICPVMNARMENRTQLEWNKDDLEALGIIKVDVLALGMLTCIRKGFDLIGNHYNKHYNLHNVPPDRRKVYDMICKADTLGVFQIESRAQMSMLPRLKPRKFYDLVIQVAIVRPGPIQGDMVHPYLRRRDGKERPDYPKKELREVLKRTKGVPLFQEQAMEIAIVAADFTPEEADQLRRSMATFKAKGEVSQFKKKFIDGMLKKEYKQDFAERVFKQIEGFGGYGFPESHAASFAHLVYISCWIKYYYPDIFCASLLNSQPMGFYQPAEIVDDARNHGVTVLPVDVNHSQWDNTIGKKRIGRWFPVRLGFRQVKGLNQEEMQRLVLHRGNGYQSLIDLSNAGISRSAIERLTDADAFRSISMDRREALWELPTVDDKPIGLFQDQSLPKTATQLSLPLMSASEHVVHDIAFTGLSLKDHPLKFVRPELDELKVSPTAKLKEKTNGAWVKVAGLITVRQRPGTAKGVLFVTIKDETGYANLVIWGKVFENFKREILQSKLFMVEGRVQIEGKVIHVITQQCFNLNRLLLTLTPQQNQAVNAIAAQGDGKSNLPISKKELRENAMESVIYKGRNFR